MWPGSAQTALLFVGLPLLTALVLLAAPLHDAPSPALPREEAATPSGVLAAEPGLVTLQPAPAAMPRAVAKRPAHDRPVPEVVYEVRRIRHRAPVKASVLASGSAPSGSAAPAVTPTTSRPRSVPTSSAEPVTLTAARPSAEARIMAASLAPQSP